jgi:beta-phosphoglucomutase-like phosphatase (HAD superfamily)
LPGAGEQEQGGTIGMAWVMFDYGGVVCTHQPAGDVAALAAVAGAGLPVARHFEHLLFSCDVRAAEPDPACFGRALGRLGASAGEVTFIDDREENVAAAARMGIRALRFTRPGQARAGLAGIIGADGRLFPCGRYQPAPSTG